MELMRAFFNALGPPEYFGLLGSLLVGFALVLLSHWLSKRKRKGAFNRDELPNLSRKIRLDKKHEEPVQSLQDAKDGALFYSQQADDFVGRLALLETFLHQFLDTSRSTKPFKWALLYGDAGSGKSRFSLELLKHFTQECPTAQCGFVSKDENDSEARISVEKVQHWPHKVPAFFVLDYASSMQNLRGLIKALKKRAEELRQPIRLLLLERKNIGEWADLLQSTSDATRFLDDTRFDDDADSTGSLGIKLPTIGEAAVAQIIRRRIEAKRPLAEAETDAYLIEQVDHFDEGRRPLFAAMVGEELARSDPDTDLASGQFGQRNARRNKLLHRYIQRERAEFWSTSEDRDKTSSSRLRHENLLALSTLCRGAPINVLENGNDELKLPNHESFERERFRRMAGKSEYLGAVQKLEDSKLLPFLEPDFVGEWFVLHSLKENYLGAAKRNFIELCWDLRSEGVVQFIRQCHQNYSDEVAQHDFFLPDPGDHVDHVARLLRAVLAEFLATIDFISDGPIAEVTGEQEHIAGRARKAFHLLKDHVDTAQTLTETARADISVAGQLYINIEAYLISGKVRAQGSIWQPDAKSASPLKLTQYSTAFFGSPELLARRGRLRDEGVFTSSTAGDVPTAGIGRESLTTVIKRIGGEELGSAEAPSNKLMRSRPTVEALALPLHSTIAQAAIHLNESASLFRSLAAQNPPLGEQMIENASVFERIANFLSTDPFGRVDENRHTYLAAKLLGDTSTFFLQLAESNPPIQNEMRQRAHTLSYISKSLRSSPLASVSLGGSAPAGGAESGQEIPEGREENAA